MIVLEVIHSDAGPIVVATARSNGALLYLQNGWCQSEADSFGVSYMPHIHAMFDLVMQAQAMRILMIGCGGGTLATMLAKANRTVTVVDVNPAAIDMSYGGIWVMGWIERAAYRGGWKPAEPPEGVDTPWTTIAESPRWCSRDQS